MKLGTAVWFNSGAGDQLALVVADNGGENLNLVAVDGNGAWQHHASVARRDPADYGPEGGGDTWHPAA